MERPLDIPIDTIRSVVTPVNKNMLVGGPGMNTFECTSIMIIYLDIFRGMTLFKNDDKLYSGDGRIFLKYVD